MVKNVNWIVGFAQFQIMLIPTIKKNSVVVVESCMESAVDSAVIRFLGLGSFHSDSQTLSIFRYNLCDHILDSCLFLLHQCFLVVTAVGWILCL